MDRIKVVCLCCNEGRYLEDFKFFRSSGKYSKVCMRCLRSPKDHNEKDENGRNYIARLEKNVKGAREWNT